MASDVEVLRGLLDPVGGQGLPEVVRRAIAAGLAALEAREAQPKAEGRMGDADAVLRHGFTHDAAPPSKPETP